MQFKEWLKLHELNYGNGPASNGPLRDRRWSQYGQMNQDSIPNPFNQAVAGVSQGLGGILMKRLYPRGNQPGFGGSFPSLMRAVMDSIETNETKDGIIVTGSSQLVPPSEDKKDNYLVVQQHTVKIIQEAIVKSMTQSGKQTEFNLNRPLILHVWMENNLLYAKIKFKRINQDEYDGWDS